MRPMDAEELKWRRRSDARTLAESEQIKADKERYQGAVLGAKEIAQEEVERVRGIAKIAGVKVPQVPKDAEQPEVQPTVRGAVPTKTEPVFRPRRSNPATIGRL